MLPLRSTPASTRPLSPGRLARPAFFAALLVSALLPLAAQPPARSAATTLTLPAELPARGYSTVDALPGLTFSQAVALVSPPADTRRLFVVQKAGTIELVPDVTLAAPTKTTFLNLASLLTSRGESLDTESEAGLLGLAFHPAYATNRHFFVFYSVKKAGVRYQRVARFTTQSGNASAADTASERVLIEQLDENQNHQGGCLAFGPDGYLYISLGDEGGQGDPFNNTQRIDKDFFSAVARIDVDKKSGNLNPNNHPSVIRDSGVARYSVPADNPYVGATTFNGLAVTASSVRTEFWAVGFRNPWRFSFDSQNGDLWLGDVGGVNTTSREEINLVTRAGNYGWAFREGTTNGPKSASTPNGFTSIAPVYSYPRGTGEFQGASVTGGIVYRGERLGLLYGAYVFADYSSGRVWSLTRTGSTPEVRRLLDLSGVAAFGTDPSNKDVLLAVVSGETVRRLVYTATETGAPLPTTLTATGAFSNLSTLTPAAGVVPYEPNVTFWSDHAVKTRWFALKDTTSTYGYATNGGWSLPTGAVWVKHFNLETVRGDPSTARRVETRFLVKTASGAYGVTYRWNDAQTEANLVPEGGATQDYTITENGLTRTQTWSFPSRANCLACHTPQGGYALSFNTRQLNRRFPDSDTNQINALRTLGYVTGAPTSLTGVPVLAPPGDLAKSTEERARAYLDANCVSCHQPGGSALGAWDARSWTPLSEAKLIDGILANDLGNSANRVIKPGNRALSALLTRISAHASVRMPPVGSSELDPHGPALVEEWIAKLGSSTATRTGLVGHYYNNTSFTGAPVYRRLDSTVDYRWGTASPAPGYVNPDGFSVRWLGRVKAVHTTGVQTYTFFTRTDDGARLWINGQQLVNRFVPQGATEYSGTVDLAAGQDYPIVLEYYDGTGGSTAELRWSTAGVTKQIIPTTALLPTPVPGLVADYFNDSASTPAAKFSGAPRQTRVEPSVNQDWKARSPQSLTNPDWFSVRWTGRVKAAHATGSQVYTFYTTSDEGVRLYVNGQLLIDRFVTQTATEHSGTITLEAGKDYTLLLEYFENTGNASAKLSWSSTGIPKQVIPPAHLLSD